MVAFLGLLLPRQTLVEGAYYSKQHGQTLMLKANGSCLYHFGFCFIGYETGRYQVDGNTLLRFDYRNLSQRYVIVQWGRQTFLVEPERMFDFIARYRKGWRAREGKSRSLFLRNDGFGVSGSTSPPPDGRPLVPYPWHL